MLEEINVAGWISLVAGGSPDCVELLGHWAFVGATGALIIINVSDVGNPTEMYSFVEANTTDNIEEMQIVGNYLYVSSDDYFSILDISDPSNVSTLGQISGAGEYLDNISGFKILGDYAYISAFASDALVIVDISDPENPTRVGQLTGAENYLDGASGIALSADGTYAFIPATNQFRISTFNISDPANPTMAGSLYRVVGALTSNVDIVRNGNYLYLLETYASGGIAVIDITTPTIPTWHSHVYGADNYFFIPYKIRINGDYAFVTNKAQDASQMGLTAYDISNITPVYTTRYEGLTDYDSKGLFVNDTFIFVTYEFSDNYFYIFGKRFTEVSRTASQIKPIAKDDVRESYKSKLVTNEKSQPISKQFTPFKDYKSKLNIKPITEIKDTSDYKSKLNIKPITEIKDTRDYRAKIPSTSVEKNYNFDELMGTIVSKIEDILIFPGDIAKDAGLESAVLISLFTDKRATIDSILPDESGSRRGWWGDQTVPFIENDEIGSYLWLLDRSKTTNIVLESAKQYAKDSLQWMVDDGIVAKIEVETKKEMIQSTNILFLKVKLYREYEDDYAPMYEGNWGLKVI